MRWVWRVVVALLVGVVVNVGVASWLAGVVPVDLNQSTFSEGYQRHGDGTATSFMSFDGTGVAFIWWNVTGQGLVSADVLRADVNGNGPRDQSAFKETPDWSWVKARNGCPHDEPAGHWECAAGWPYLSMRWCTAEFMRPPRVRFDPSWSGFRARDKTPRRAFPLSVLWAGFVANTGVYAAVALLVMMAPGWARRRRRRVSGHCARCGYARGNLAICPECGEGQNRAAAGTA